MSKQGACHRQERSSFSETFDANLVKTRPLSQKSRELGDSLEGLLRKKPPPVLGVLPPETLFSDTNFKRARYEFVWVLVG